VPDPCRLGPALWHRARAGLAVGLVGVGAGFLAPFLASAEARGICGSATVLEDCMRRARIGDRALVSPWRCGGGAPLLIWLSVAKLYAAECAGWHRSVAIVARTGQWPGLRPAAAARAFPSRGRARLGRAGRDSASARTQLEAYARRIEAHARGWDFWWGARRHVRVSRGSAGHAHREGRRLLRKIDRRLRRACASAERRGRGACSGAGFARTRSVREWGC